MEVYGRYVEVVHGVNHGEPKPTNRTAGRPTSQLEDILYFPFEPLAPQKAVASYSIKACDRGGIASCFRIFRDSPGFGGLKSKHLRGYTCFQCRFNFRTLATWQIPCQKERTGVCRQDMVRFLTALRFWISAFKAVWRNYWWWWPSADQLQMLQWRNSTQPPLWEDGICRSSTIRWEA